jgi:hypothetical protein
VSERAASHLSDRAQVEHDGCEVLADHPHMTVITRRACFTRAFAECSAVHLRNADVVGVIFREVRNSVEALLVAADVVMLGEKSFGCFCELLFALNLNHDRLL